INKIDLPEANPELVKRQLAEKGLIPEVWGGDTIFVEISAKQRINIDKLLEMILLQSEVLELKANPEKLARGVIIESRLDKGQGPVATVLIQEGTLKIGDPFVTGQIFGKVRAMLDDKGKKIKKATPSYPVEVVGFPENPHAGELFVVVSDERKARMVAEYRKQKERQLELAQSNKVTLENLCDKIKQEEVKELKLIVKADVHGSIEAIQEALGGLSTKEIKLNIIHSAVGAINESDVMLAVASNAVIIGFNVTPDQKAQSLAQTEKVEIRTYSIIYEIIEDIKKAMEGLLAPIQKEKFLGRAEVLQTFPISKVGTVAGSRVIEGKIVRGALARLLRNGKVIHEGKISSLRRFKDDVKEALQGYECGILLEGLDDIKVNDIIEAYTIEEVAQKLD
ncbi:MAG: translation initiation factor IF-2, partial [Desulfobacterota bacterium]|nr:translation initiation factor IF-2 [Thermodesulfobacteriota bacterium]